MLYSNWQNKCASLWALCVFLAAIGLALLWGQSRLQFQTDVFKLLPAQQQNTAIKAANEHMNQWLNRQLFVMISAPTEDALNQASTEIVHRFEQSSLWLKPKPVLDTRTLGQLLFQHKAALLSADDIANLQTGNHQALIDDALLQLNSPAIAINDDLLQQDPLLFFPRYLLGLQHQNPSDITLYDGFPSRELNGRFYRLLPISLSHSPFNIDYQQQALPWLKQLQQHYPSDSPEVAVTLTGTLVYASAGTQAAQKEVSTIGVGSTLGLIFLVWFGFKSFRPLLTELAAVTSGCVMAILVTQLIFGEVHVMTMVFGASLIGASIDFSFYYLFMQAHHSQQTSWQVMQRLLPDLTVGLLTTLAAYLCLLLTPFPGLRQIAVFSMVGLSAAWLTSLLLLPYLKALDTSRAVSTLQILSRLRTAFIEHRRWRLSLIAASLLLTLIMLPLAKVNDDVHSLQTLDTQWSQQEAAIKHVFGQQQSSQYFVVHADNEAATEALESQLLSRLDTAKQQQQLASIQALGLVLPSLATQKHNQQLLQAIPASVLLSYAEQTGLPNATLQQWQQQLPQQALLSPTALLQHPAAALRVDATTRMVLVTDVQHSSDMQRLADELPGVFWVEPIKNLSQIFQHYRQQSMWRLAWGLLLLALALAAIYGRQAVVGLMLPVSLALLNTFALQAALGIEINLFGLMAAFLVVGIGVDYAVFYQHTEHDVPVVAYALFLCMLAAILGFGLLALSQTQAIANFGTTVLLGVLFSYLYANLLTLPSQLNNKGISHE